MSVRGRLRGVSSRMKTAGLPRPPRPVSAGTVVSQYGDKNGYREVPRFADVPEDWDPETHLSMSVGTKTPEELHRGMRGRPPKPGSGAKARYFMAGALQEAGYTVAHTPSGKNPDHVDVGPLLGVTLAEAEAWWAVAQRVRLHVLVHAEST